jgi:hypothetical protein
MEAEAEGPNCESEKRNQRTVWVSATETIIGIPNAENSQASQRGFDRSLLPMARALISPECRVRKGSALSTGELNRTFLTMRLALALPDF